VPARGYIAAHDRLLRALGAQHTDTLPIEATRAEIGHLGAGALATRGSAWTLW
jgi:hypothetical protein